MSSPHYHEHDYHPDRHTARIMVVDDERANLILMERLLRSDGYANLVLVQDPRQVMSAYREARTDLILLDIQMPYMDGFQVIEQLVTLQDPLLPPILALTAQASREYMLRALNVGARDFIGKPFDRAEVLARVRNMLDVQLAHRMTHDQKDVLEQMVRERTREIRRTRLQVVQRLGRAAEYRDNETGFHILRMSHTSELLARHLGWSQSECERLLHASPMHDVGKIGIPDSILLKPGKLTPEEWRIMQTHTTIGGDILGGDESDLLNLAREIALTHHEKWDGSGYPLGLSGEEIPVSGRITALADVFDALTSERTYKKAWPVQDALELIRELSGSHFDPQLTELFFSLVPEILAIRDRFAEPQDPEALERRCPGGNSDG
ncbi:response regulator receiver modulated metal dependent phosphohydrolase [Ectothiorhodospira sp. PHS-1]|uniref:HD domain-containing phosphohydrolase n=1 Tax=Ectothiorhodospira sp. PHS-1 TaxID=519989 RepID=UPI00024A856D|nr:HD domain-containing phosphohydrolase [Ectothiorhodospira sp. PHS-1]EHQ51718.1 response regulator receiver modulated metal dependent phosphohydrolase [Ectothiorhodospira sp. PHS-1]